MQAPIRTDFGVKIGGARKDLAGNVTRDDILSMTPEERLKLIRKDVVWPAPDFVAMVTTGGYTQKAAAMVKMLRDCFPSAPSFSARATDEQKAVGSELYAALLNAAKAITHRGKTEVDLAAAFRDAPEAKEFLFDVGAAAHGSSDEFPHRMSISPSRRFGEIIEAAFNGSVNDSLCIRGGMRTFAEGKIDYAMSKLLNRNKEWPRGTSLVDGWLRKAAVSIVQHGEGFALARRDVVPPHAHTYEAGRLTQDGFGAMIGKTYSTKEAGEGEMRKVGEDFFEAKRTAAKVKRDAVAARALGKDPAAPTNSLVDRVGKDHRQGADATGEDYLARFGLRGGEYGLWVNNEERLEVTNKGFDSFCDLAEAFGLPHESVSLGGTLAIAFGARGRGGNAAAHYEPGRTVINLTKPSGEGCLAHEFGHALDHFLGGRAKALGLVDHCRDMEHPVYLSNLALKPAKAGENEEAVYVRRFHKAIDSISQNTTPMTKEELLETADRSRALSLKNLAIVTSNASLTLVGQYAMTPDALAARKAVFEAHAALIRRPEEGRMIESLAKGVEGILSMDEFKRGNSRSDLAVRLNYAVQAVKAYDEKAALPPNWTGDSRPRKTAYAGACARLDKERSKPYYGLAHEMFARTLEATVTETMKEQGHVNFFLVAGANGEAYPADRERAAFAATFGNLMEELQPHLPQVALRPAAMAPAPRPSLPEPMAASRPGTQLDLL